MADFKKPNVIDGFSSVQALRHAGKTSKPRLGHSPSTLSVNKPKTDDKSAGTVVSKLRIGQTAIPQKHNIICYECTYAFVLTGKLSKTICPKCHKTLDTTDRTISSKELLKIRTIGVVHVDESAELLDKSKVLARNLIIAGNVENADLDYTGTLELCHGAKIDVRRINFKDIIVRTGGQHSIARKLECNNIDVKGDIKGNIHARGQVTIYAGGTLRGKITTAHLIVHDGGGLVADVNIVSA